MSHLYNRCIVGGILDGCLQCNLVGVVCVWLVGCYVVDIFVGSIWSFCLLVCCVVWVGLLVYEILLYVGLLLLF